VHSNAIYLLQFIINVNITKEFVYQHAQVNPRFIQWRNEQGNYGLQFLDPQDAAKFAEQLKTAIELFNKQNNGMNQQHNSPLFLLFLSFFSIIFLS
jgi:hypothetical protein